MNVFRAFRKNPPPTPEREGGLEFHRRSVALSPSAWLALNELAKSEGITKSELVRRIVNSFMTERDRPQFNQQRIAIICEYVQFVADERGRKMATVAREDFYEMEAQRVVMQAGE